MVLHSTQYPSANSIYKGTTQRINGLQYNTALYMPVHHNHTAIWVTLLAF
ncbi:hypothetical protein ccbrp13_05200 [Ktedonobacteria bacterium brp13]|nr:hypothetical protein ccbrp13_05200 [Ktedonobacteria bacterium brp13]